MKHFEEKLSTVGHLDFFQLAVSNATRILEVSNRKGKSWNYSQAWKKEAVDRWGFHEHWMPCDPIKIPEDAPAPVFRQRLRKDAEKIPIIEEPALPAHSDDYPDVPAIEDVSFNDQVRWAQRMLGHDPEKIPKRQIPSLAHVKMLHFANSDTDRFYRWVQLLDEKDESLKRTEKQFEDDNRKVFKIFDNIIADLERRERREQMAKISTPVAEAVVGS